MLIYSLQNSINIKYECKYTYKNLKKIKIIYFLLKDWQIIIFF